MRKKESLLKEILEEQLALSRAKNPRFSLRAFAKRLNISPATLSRVMSKKSNLSAKMARHIIENLKIDPKIKNKLHKTEHDPYVLLEPRTDTSDFANIWYLSSILTLAETDDFREDPKWIAQRLGLKVNEAKKGIRRLIEMGFLRRDEKGALHAMDIAFTTHPPDPHQPDRNHLKKVDRIKEYLLHERGPQWGFADFGSIILSSSPKKMKEVKTRSKTFRRQIAKFMDAGEKNEVYMVFTAVIPLSKIRGTR